MPEVTYVRLGKPSPEELPHAVPVSNFSLPQLNGMKKQLEDELDHLTASFTKLRTAQAKFRECLKSIAEGVENAGEGKFIYLWESAFFRSSVRFLVWWAGFSSYCFAMMLVSNNFLHGLPFMCFFSSLARIAQLKDTS